MASKGDIHLEEASGQEARPQPGQGVSHTPGPWEYGEHPAIPSMASVRPVLLPRNVHVLPPHEGNMVLLRNKADARLIAAAPDFYTALRGDPEDPGEISPISWLHSAVAELVQRGPPDDCDDVGAYWMMIDELRGLCERGRLAIAKAEGAAQ